MSKELNTKVTNVLVIGSGGAGLSAAIEAKLSGADVIVIGKRFREDVHTALAAGGINASLGNIDKKDSWQQHFADTYIEGYGIGNPTIIEIMTKEAPNAVIELENWGVNFAKTNKGDIDQRYFGAHTYRRTCYCGDFTGSSILNTLLKKADSLDIPIIDDQYVTQLLIKNKSCFGAISFNTINAKRSVFLADAVILATGGHTRIWKRSSSRKDENNGDGIYLALEAGCKLIDMEMVQFHPTGMLLPPEKAGSLVTEAVRGEGGKLFNKKGERFMKNYDPIRMELSTRDRVAIACYMEIAKGNSTKNGGLFLDISHRSKNYILEKLPKIYNQFLELQNLDISKEAMEIAPTAHYSMGGILVSPESHFTGIDGLYAAGEVAGGLHGANRLGGNSLAEIIVFGKKAGKAGAIYSNELKTSIKSEEVIKIANKNIDFLIKKGSENPLTLLQQISEIMWEYCGVVREEKKLKIGLHKIKKLKSKFQNLNVSISNENCDELISAYNFKFSLISAEATIISAIERKESRGAHQRSDFQEIDKDLQFNYSLILNKSNQLSICKESKNLLKKELEKFVLISKEIKNFEGKLLE